MIDASFFQTGIIAPGLLWRYGITRVGDLTGLDDLGLPVWFACRPNSRTLSVSQGKGLTPAQARISAIMEALEDAMAEQGERLVEMTGSPSSLQAQGLTVVDLNRILRCAGTAADPDCVRHWVPGCDLLSGTPVWAPYELVGLDLRTDAAWDRQSFHMSSIGLAAGQSRDQAILHGLLELIENDTTAIADLFGLSGQHSQPVSPYPGRHPGLDQALHSLRRAGLEPVFHHFAGPLDLPVIGCFLERPLLDGLGPQPKTMAGFACRLNASDAALAALLEAAQSRVTDVAGAREDIGEHEYQRGDRPVACDRPAISLDAVFPDARATAPPQTEIIALAQRIASRCGAPVYVFPLAPQGLGFEVVRVIVPGFAHTAAEGYVRSGEQMIDFLTGVEAAP